MLSGMVSIPAEVTSALIHRWKEWRHRRSGSYQVDLVEPQIAYTYHYQGTTYSGTRVTAIDENWDDNDSYELLYQCKTGKVTTAYCKPASPGESILLRQPYLRPYVLLDFGGVTFVLAMLTLCVNRRPRLAVWILGIAVGYGAALAISSEVLYRWLGGHDPIIVLMDILSILPIAAAGSALQYARRLPSSVLMWPTRAQGGKP